MNKSDISQWYFREYHREIPPGWDITAEDCLDYIVSDARAQGFLECKKQLLNKVWNFIATNSCVYNECAHLHGVMKEELFTYCGYQEECE